MFHYSITKDMISELILFNYIREKCNNLLDGTSLFIERPYIYSDVRQHRLQLQVDNIASYFLCSNHAELGNLAQTKNCPASAPIYQQSTLILIKNIIGYSLLVN